ncbi:hypothetical protein DSM106972_016140 [Dulcicalothrix desertica PCC 7102]|uniref:Uncharacterized protein n=1 Tax=Dulcicalothrix desertica PCC 7102 TaxID=232991 RepID=A0A3S1BB19_9CYAN|nr:hypothetical protein [Dulcicalothrix desertica]RUT08446.1 hypothetical protein DSM106972_016140 [Dulcicalothrix desertica PCC 7102]
MNQEIEKILVSKERITINSLVIWSACNIIANNSPLSVGEISDQLADWAKNYYLTLAPAERESFISRFYPPDEAT